MNPKGDVRKGSQWQAFPDSGCVLYVVVVMYSIITVSCQL